MKQGLYEQIINQLTASQLAKLDEAVFEVGRERLDATEAKKMLSSYIASVTRKALSIVRDDKADEDEALLAQIRLCNDMIATLTSSLGQDEIQELALEEKGEVLTYVYSKVNHARGLNQAHSSKEKSIRPTTPLSQSSLFTGAHAEPSMINELKKEILTADRIDFLVSFIKWSGIRLFIEELRDFTDHGGQLRIVTTTYMEATDYKAIEELAKLANTHIKISYDTHRTRLHAKAYAFYRETGFTTAYIGSSNLSHPALTSGLEWNVKITEKDAFDVVKRMEATYESYWYDQEFHDFSLDEDSDVKRLQHALQKKKGNEAVDWSFGFAIRPYDFQKEVLEKLDVERTLYGRMRNLVVAATGVGKTVIAAFDFKRFCAKKPGAKLLFVAHREEILRQSRDTFRWILQDLNFGEMQVNHERATSIDHLFISIQSFQSKKLDTFTSPDFYDFIIVDEFHHAAAPSYQKLLTHYQPAILLGLTATPERMDGQDILSYFDDTMAAEIRLSDAIDRKLLCPFHYFGVTDYVDVSKVKWSRKGYDWQELDHLYTNNSIRAKQILRSVQKYVTDLEGVKGLGFCVSVQHAQYMAKIFNEAGVPSLALHAQTHHEERNEAKKRLVSGAIKMIFVVDLYNEGVDIPEVNTILFLRPTESLTVFLQQLGRGLRLADDKECLTVLDFIGQAHQSYNFQEKFRALIGTTKHDVSYYVEHGFSHLPRGSYISLEKQAADYILSNLRQAIINKRYLIDKMKYFEADTGLSLTLHHFIDFYRMSLQDFYGRRHSGRTFQGMMAEAGCRAAIHIEDKETLLKRIPSLLTIDSKRWLSFVLAFLEEGREPQSQEERIMLTMLYYSFYRTKPQDQNFAHIEEGIGYIFSSADFREEIIAILRYNLDHLHFVPKPNTLPFVCPLEIHCRYTIDQILAAVGYWQEDKAPAFREGVLYLAKHKTDMFFITLNKSEKDYSPSTLYEDYAVNERLFHWQTQSRTSTASTTGQRYMHHRETGGHILLFVREYKEQNGVASPYVYLGEADYVSHSGDKPISFLWRLREAMPASLVPIANKGIM